MAIPINKSLYSKVKAEAKRRFKVWPSAYGSGWLVREYKRRGGKYREGSSSRSKKRSYRQKSKGKGLTRWFDEKWINVCKLPKKVPCGRPKRSTSIEEWRRKYPYCRPSKKITPQSPTPYTSLSKEKIKSMCKKKRKDPKRRMGKV